MIRLKWGSRSESDFTTLLDAVPRSALDSPRRSVVPLLDFWRHPEARLQELTALLGADLTSADELAFEYTVPVRRGKGKASCTDLMILGPEIAAAIEAKYKEPRYESVAAWLRDPAEANRSQVLDGWLELINEPTGLRLRREQVLDIPYQLIHRTASAFSLKVRQRIVLYLVFDDGSGPHDSGIKELVDVMGGVPDFQFRTVKCLVQKTEGLQDLEAKWNQGERKMGDVVRAALETGPLYEFDPPTLEPA